MTGHGGHCYGYMSPVRELLQERGHEVHVLCNRGAAAAFAGETGVIPAFTYWCDERNVGQPSGLDVEENADAVRAGHERALVGDLRDLDRRFRFTRDDLLVVNTLRHWALGGLLKFLEELGHERAPRISAISLFSAEPSLGRYGPAIRHYREFFALLAASPLSNRLKLFTDADTLVEEYRSLGAVAVGLAPFPQRQNPLRRRTGERGIVISYLGEARLHKGFHLLPYVARRLEHSGVPNVKLKVQSFCSDRAQPFYALTLTALSEQSNVELLPDLLTERQYADLLDETDVVLLPYTLEHYHRQTSAVYAAAAAQGSVAVVSRGTWMARKVTEHGGGRLCLPQDFLSVADATADVCRDFDDYAAAAYAAGARWRAFNNAASFVDVVDWREA